MTPTTEQQAIITAPESHILVLAGAGSGKTRTLVWRIEHDISQGTNPDDMVCITFTNRAAKELADRLAAAGIKIGFIGTLHAYALAMVSRHRAVLGYTRHPEVIDEETATAMRKSALKDLHLPASTTLQAIDDAIGQAGSSNAHLAAKGYLKSLRRLGKADFTSLLADLETLASKGFLPQISALYVDEYQDSGARDARIYKALNASLDFRVGDVDQSMYSFRGGKIANILALAGNRRTYHLTANYRSASKIVAYANGIIRRNVNPTRRPMTPTRNVEGTISITSYPTAAIEAASIAAFIKASCRSSSDFAILTRYNSRVAEIKRHLEQEGIMVAARKQPQAPTRLIAALRALQYPRLDDESMPWVYSIDSPNLRTEADKTGSSLTGTLLKRLDVQAGKEPLGASLGKMMLQAHEIAQIRDAWVGSHEETILALQLSDAENDSEGVHVGTVHSFKGGEKPVVFVCGMEAETTPAKKTGEEYDEERRIYYVACTRAQDDLRISWSAITTDSSGMKTIIGNASPFLNNRA